MDPVNVVHISSLQGSYRAMYVTIDGQDIYLVPGTDSLIVGVREDLVTDVHVWELSSVTTSYLHPVPIVQEN